METWFPFRHYLQDGHPGKVQVYIHPRAVASASDAVGQVATAGDLKSKTKKDGSVEFWVNSGHMWTQHEQTFREICQAVHKGWKQNREKRTEEELADREEDAASQQSHRV
jgi:hypothetical protein